MENVGFAWKAGRGCGVGHRQPQSPTHEQTGRDNVVNRVCWIWRAVFADNFHGSRFYVYLYIREIYTDIFQIKKLNHGKYINEI